MKPLKDRYRRFVREYLVDLSIVGAYRRAGFKGKGTTARVSSCKIFYRPEIQEAIAEAREAQLARVDLRADDVLRELRSLAFASLRDVVRWGPEGVAPLDSDDLPADTAAAVADVSWSPGKHGDSWRVKMCDKVRALELLGKHLGLFVERVAGADGKSPVEHVLTVKVDRAEADAAVAEALAEAEKMTPEELRKYIRERKGLGSPGRDDAGNCRKT